MEKIIRVGGKSRQFVKSFEVQERTMSTMEELSQEYLSSKERGTKKAQQ